MFLGACCKIPTLCLLLEHCEHGDVQEYFVKLRMDPASSFTCRHACRIATDVARALVYLHDARSIMHRDLKLRNVLLASNGAAKVRVCWWWCVSPSMWLSHYLWAWDFCNSCVILGWPSAYSPMRLGSHAQRRVVPQHGPHQKWSLANPTRSKLTLCVAAIIVAALVTLVVCTPGHSLFIECWAQYSLGVVLWELFNLCEPFGGCRSVSVTVRVLQLLFWSLSLQLSFFCALRLQ
jgi:hypothetical protein